MKDVMLDLETLGTSSNAVVVQIGACYFNRKTGEIGDKFKVNVDIQSSLDKGFEVSGSTINWWLNQSDEARKLVFSGAKINIEKAISMLNDFLVDADCIWSHATFDIVIINNHLNKLGIKPVYKYWSARDIRTLTDLGDVKAMNFANKGVAHDALADCLFQVKYCVEAMNKLKGK